MIEKSVKDILETEFRFVVDNHLEDMEINSKNNNVNIDYFLDFLSYINKETVTIDDTDFSKSIEQKGKEACMEKLNKDFFWNQNFQRKGKERDCEDIKHLLGHVVCKKELYKDFKLINDKDINESTLYDENYMLEICTQKSNVLTEDFKDFFGIKIRMHQMWCFSNGKDEGLLNGYNLEDLLIKLALQDFIGKQFFFFEIKKPRRQPAFKPTIFDAGFKELWKPGGYTIPLDRTQGFEEMMVEKLNYEHITNVSSFAN